MNSKKLLLQILFLVLLFTLLSSATVGNVLFRTNDRSNDIIRVSDDKVKDFHTYAENYKQTRVRETENVWGRQCRQKSHRTTASASPADIAAREHFLFRTAAFVHNSR